MTTPDRLLTIGPRQLEILRLLWEHGPATVTQLHAWLRAEPPIAYSTMQTICVTLTTKGLLTRRPAAATTARAANGNPYIYEPTIAPAIFTHVMVGRTRRVIASYPADQIGTPAEPKAATSDADLLTTLRERVAVAEQAAMHWESTAHRAERRIEALERRANAAERRAEEAERTVQRLTAQLNRPPRPKATPHRPREVITEHRSTAGICRVCGAPSSINGRRGTGCPLAFTEIALPFTSRSSVPASDVFKWVLGGGCGPPRTQL
jgi:predicted transcriptional regulator